MAIMMMSTACDTLPQLSFDYVTAARRRGGPLASMSTAEIEVLALRYRRFLSLKARYPQHAIAPTEIIDEMWHLHMLHPRAYFNDCMIAFGSILDHHPGFGSTAEERPRLEKIFARTSELWEAEFGEAYCLRGGTMQNLIVCADEEEDESDSDAPSEEQEKEEGEPDPGVSAEPPADS